MSPAKKKPAIASDTPKKETQRKTLISALKIKWPELFVKPSGRRVISPAALLGLSPNIREMVIADLRSKEPTATLPDAQTVGAFVLAHPSLPINK